MAEPIEPEMPPPSDKEKSPAAASPSISEGTQRRLPMELPEEEAGGARFDVSLLALAGITGLGHRGIKALADALQGDLGRVWGASLDLIRGALAKARVPGPDKVAREILLNSSARLLRGEAEVAELAQKRVQIIPGAQLPAKLVEIPDPPRWLFVQGKPSALHFRPSVAVVGTRKATPEGRTAAANVAKMMAAYPIALVSGLAEGIDEEAHRASLQERVINVAFLGHGINVTFPAVTARLREKIVESGGAVCTEYLPDEHYQKSYFVERDRLQAGLADLVIPVEATPKGGTAHTIRFATSLGRRLVGIRLKSSNGLVSELEREGVQIISAFGQSGWRELDKVFRDLAEGAGHQTYALSLVERRLVSEMRSRNIRPEDISRLMSVLEGTQTEG